jgi:hypothetical protein
MGRAGVERDNRGRDADREFLAAVVDLKQILKSGFRARVGKTTNLIGKY